MDQTNTAEAQTTAGRRHDRRWGRVRGGIVVVSALGLVGTLLVNALFTDVATNPNNVFSSGTVDINTTPSESVAIAYPTMAPGDFISAPIVVTNSGTLDLRYALKSVTTNDAGLVPVLKMWIRSGGTAGSCLSAMSIAAFQGWGTAGTAGDRWGVATSMEDAAGTGGAILGSVAGTKLIGDAATGQNGTINVGAGDRVLAPAAAETLCVRILLPTNTTGAGTGAVPTPAYQASSATAVFTFDAEQTKNN